MMIQGHISIVITAVQGVCQGGNLQVSFKLEGISETDQPVSLQDWPLCITEI